MTKRRKTTKQPPRRDSKQMVAWIKKTAIERVEEVKKKRFVVFDLETGGLIK